MTLAGTAGRDTVKPEHVPGNETIRRAVVAWWPGAGAGCDEALPAPLPPYRVLTGLADSYDAR